MSVAGVGGLVMGTELNVRGMAAIVEEFVSGDMSLLRDERWLRQRAEASGLDHTEYAGLEALRVRLLKGGGKVLDSVSNLFW